MQQQQLPPYQNIGYSPCVNFVPDGPAYRTCCCHVTRGTLLIGAVVLIMSVLALVASAAAYEYDSFTSLGIKIPVALLSCILSILLIVAVKYEKPILLIPFLIWQIIYFIAAMVIAGFLIWVLVVLSNSAEDEKEVKKGEPIDKVTNSPTDLDSGVSTVAFGLVLINLLICLITGAMDCYFFYVVKRCYGFFKDKIALCKRAPIIGETMPMPEVINSLEYRVSL